MQAALLGNANSVLYTVGIGNNSSFYGYNLSQVQGSISIPTFKGAAIKSLESGTQLFAEYDLNITLGGTLAQTAFQYILAQTTSGSLRLFRSSDAAFSTDGTNSYWSWDTDTPVWTSTTPSSRLLLIGY